MKGIGHRTWAIADGHIPLISHGREPDFVSADKLCVLNTSDSDAELEITIYYSERDPIGPYPLKVGARRVRHVRLNDLIDPQAIPLNVPYGAVIHSSVPVIVQITRRDTGQAENALIDDLRLSRELMSNGDLSVLSAMVTPTVLILATGSLLLTTSQRLSRSMDRVRKIAAAVDESVCGSPNDERQAELGLQLEFAARRSSLLQRAMVCLYVAQAAFVSTSLLLGLLEILGTDLDWIPVVSGIVGTLLLLVASLLLIMESRVALRAVHAETRSLTRRCRTPEHR